MEIESFDDLLKVARAQPDPQRLLFVFAGVQLPEDCTPEQRVRFEAGEGGALAPVMCVDKSLSELTDFGDLVDESSAMGVEWQIAFVAALSGTAGCMPSSHDARKPLQHMVEAVRQGTFAAYIPFDRTGMPLRFD